MDDDEETAMVPVEAEPLEKSLERRSFITRIRKMKYCSDRCPAYDYCPMMPLSQNKEGAKKPCCMRTMPEKIKKRFERLFLQGQEGLVNELLSSVYTIGMKTDLEGEIADHRAYAQLLMATTKVLYGDKLELAGEQKSTITVNVISLEDTLKLSPREADATCQILDVEPKRLKTDEEMMAEYDSKWREG